MIGIGMPRARRLGFGLAMLLAVSGCEAQQDIDNAPVEAAADEAFGSLPPSAATIAMRWQLLNPDVNSFTFRNTQDVFAFRMVEAPADTWELSRREGFTMPAATVAGEDADYAAWADRTFTNGFIVLRDGDVVFEDYRNRMTAETPHIAFSMSKTLTAMLVGQALDRGEIASLDDLVSTYVPELAGGAYGRATIRNILEMRSGADILERYDFGENPSLAGLIHQTAIVENKARFADFAVDLGNRAEPGAQFNYATLDTAVLGWMLEEATGQKLEDLMESRIWQPMGAEFDGHFLADGPVGEGRALNGMGFNATLRDFARLGQVMLAGGMAGDTRILPEGWVDQMTVMKPTGAPLPGYGLQTWQVDNEPGAFAAVGLAGQYIYVHPASGTVIVKLSYNPPAEPEWLDGEVLGYFARVANAR
ncbi:serine hydrolase [Alteraurantiacibacter aestuarii]|uniref:Serine hydrolase n=1 Tax=Alteraurantiacibacter aestuarii TaxID=650004 RepID=A0A844ZIL7_9SPHN|nr:serine hydrolase [Alteraurantiacibacter aestuarii]MXO87283.1 serine hydrolase [Alteraurantiacibacter aestuarii]